MICKEIGILTLIPTDLDGGLRVNKIKVKEKDLDPLAIKLSRLVDKDPPWSGNYLYNVIHDKLDPSKKLSLAIERYAQVLDGIPSILAGYEPVTVYALPGKIQKNTVITGESRECRRPDCPIHFVKRVWNQEYCSPECNKQDRSRRRAKGGWS